MRTKGRLATAGRWVIAVATMACVTCMLSGAGAAKRDRGSRGVLVPPSFSDTVNTRMGLRDSRIVDLDLDVDASRGRPLRTTLEIADGTMTLDLAPHSVRGASFRVLESGRGGALTEVAPRPARTLRGAALEAPGSFVAGSILDDGLHAMIDLPDGRRYWIEPIGRFTDDPAATGGLHAVYRDLDVIAPEGGCGVGDDVLARAHQALAGGDEPSAPGPDGPSDPDVAELACDADYHFFLNWGEETADRVEAIVNQVNVQYERDVDITHHINAIIVRTQPVYTTTDAQDLMIEFRSRWLSQHGDIVRDLAHLFSGKELDGNTIGIAWGIGLVCTTQAYCLSETDFNSNLNCVTDLVAHELGHLWNAAHCACPSFTMNPFINCANVFSQVSKSTIISHRDSRTCLNSPPISPYCAAGGTDTAFESISRVMFNTIDNASGAAGYSDFTTISTSVDRNADYNISVTLGGTPYAGDIGGVWIDWNTDGDFEDAGEAIPTAWSGVGPYSATVTVPPDAGPGDTVMRVRIQDGAANPTLSPCGTTSYGEVEDYTVFIIDDTPPPPPNDGCVDATPVTEGVHAFTTVSATTDGPDEPVECDESGYSQIDSDVWFRFESDCMAAVTVSLCNSAFDTKIAVYNGCPTVKHLSVIACNDDACGDQSVMEFGAFEGESYLIRVGGFEGAQGEGEMEIIVDCMGEPCPADFDDDGAVAFADLVALLFAWGPCDECPEDLDDDGDVDFQDLTTLLFLWGPC